VFTGGTPPAQVPEPSAASLLLAGLLGVTAVRARRRSRVQPFVAAR
jgi:hypothetical protein